VTLLSVYWPAIVVAFVVTTIELTEVVVLVFALSAETPSLKPGAYGATTGVALVAVLALGFGAALIALPRSYLLWAAAVVLAAFGVFLFRSTLKSYRRSAAAAAGAPPPPPRTALAFGGGFTVGAIEATEVVVVLLALTAAGYGSSALLGAVVAGVVLVAATLTIHERIRRIKVPWLKLGGTAALFTFAVFWAGEAAGFPWPGSDLSLLPLFVVAVLAARGLIALEMRPRPAPAAA
jgi:Ca2+/H+ antiporter, TMEM165/GDT1 family